MKRINTSGPNFATDMARIQLDLQMGNTPDPEKLKEVADGIEEAVTDWLSLLETLNTSPDFQTREYAKVTQVHLSNNGQTSDVVAKMMKWQAGCMRAMAEQRPPPMPPAGVDLEKIMEQAKGGKAAPSMVGMTNAEQITGSPFKGTEKAFESDTVKEEYEALCRDHSALIDMGANFDSFDPVGKVAFLDQVEAVEERWDVFFARFSLLGELDRGFVEQCDAFLEGMGLDERDFRGLLKQAHELMREEAEKERIA